MWLRRFAAVSARGEGGRPGLGQVLGHLVEGLVDPVIQFKSRKRPFDAVGEYAFKPRAPELVCEYFRDGGLDAQDTASGPEESLGGVT